LQVFDKLAQAPAAMRALMADRDARRRLQAAASHVTAWLAAKERRSRGLSRRAKSSHTESRPDVAGRKGAAEALPRAEYTEDDFEFRAIADWIVYECDRHERLPDFWLQVGQLRHAADPADQRLPDPAPSASSDGEPNGRGRDDSARKRGRDEADAEAISPRPSAGSVSPRCIPLGTAQLCAMASATPIGVAT